MNRRFFILCIALFINVCGVSHAATSGKVERWDYFEISLKGPAAGNPFVDVQLSAVFTKGERSVTAGGFYDGDGHYIIRFSPDEEGRWTYRTQSSVKELSGKQGVLVCTPSSKDNHGPVHVHDTFRLAYADGTPHFSVGTTCYAWVHQGDAMEEQTLATLKNSPFNKIRMCVFPKSYTYNKNEPVYYPYEGTPLKQWNFRRFNPAFWHHFEKRVLQLRDMGIEADIIIFHPYDRWGFKSMGHENNLFYLRYLVSRLAAFRNVWWSFANEYDLHRWPMEHWDEYMQLVQRIDPCNRLRGIHNCRQWYDHTKPWVTHCSIQNSDFTKTQAYRRKYRKPVIFDECRYEGNIPQGWGNITAQQMTRNFWMGSLAGCYVGHGETYKHPKDLLWWSKGGVLRGESPARIQFMKEIIEALPYRQMSPDFSSHPNACILAKPGECYLVYFRSRKPVTLSLPKDSFFKVDGIDTWAMTVVPFGSAASGAFTFVPPKQEYALRLIRYVPGEKLRPQAKATADKQEGIAPFTVRFSTPWKKRCLWTFGDGSESTERSPHHTFERPGIYTVLLTVIDDAGTKSSTTLQIRIDRNTGEPVIKVGFAGGDTPKVSLHGDTITRSKDGAYNLGAKPPFAWIKVGDGPVKALEGARSFTIMGWLKAASLTTGPGGNRILFSLKRDHAGVDLVHHADGRMRLAVNEWPDRIDNDSSNGKVRIGEWIFFAVTYDATRSKDSVCWYFGDEETPAALDRKTGYRNSSVGEGGGCLVIGNFNKTLQSAGLDRQFRGTIRGLQIYASRLVGRGVLPLEKIRSHQKER